MSYVPRLKTKYSEAVVPALMKQFNYTSVMQVPRLVKIAINQGIGDATGDKKLIDNAITEMTTITGQKAISVKAKKSVSNFKLREGMPIGVKVTLRSERMFEFLDRFITVALPRASATSVESTTRALTVVATIRLASRSRSSTPKSISKK